MDTATLSLLGTSVLTDGISFLYGQAGELLGRRRDREQKRRDGDSMASQKALDGALDTTRGDEKVLDQLETVIAEDRGKLNPYWEGYRPVDPQDERLLTAMARLRSSLEAVYGQAITFSGEDRKRTGTTVSVHALLGDVYGDARVARIGTIRNADVDIHVTTQTIGEGGSLSVGEIDQIGSSAPGDQA